MDSSAFECLAAFPQSQMTSKYLFSPVSKSPRLSPQGDLKHRTYAYAKSLLLGQAAPFRTSCQNCCASPSPCGRRSDAGALRRGAGPGCPPQGKCHSPSRPAAVRSCNPLVMDPSIWAREPSLLCPSSLHNQENTWICDLFFLKSCVSEFSVFWVLCVMAWEFKGKGIYSCFILEPRNLIFRQAEIIVALFSWSTHQFQNPP